MDEMIFQCNNQNSIYVLNSNYKTYENLVRRSNFIDTSSTGNKNTPHYQQSTTPRSSSSSSSAVSQTLPHKLRTLANFRNGTKTIDNPVTSPPPLGPATTITLPYTGCLPTTTAFEKCFTGSNVAIVGGGSTVGADGVGNTFNPMGGNCCGRVVDARVVLSNCKSKNNNKEEKKKSANVKPSLIAKKAKFRKFIEERESRDFNNSDHHDSHSNKGAFGTRSPSAPIEWRTNSSVKELNVAESTAPTVSMAAMTICGTLNSIVKHYSNGKMLPNAESSGREREQKHSQSNHWSGSGDSSNQHQQHQQQLRRIPQQQKNSYELYKEAAELFGFSCTFCDNCRCLDCQSNYFDCDDSDNYSDYSTSDECDDETMNALNKSVELVMYANCYSDATSYELHQQQQQQQHTNFVCTDVNCNSTKLLVESEDNRKLTRSEVDGVMAVHGQTVGVAQNELNFEEAGTKAEEEAPKVQRLARQKLHQGQPSNELQNCVNFSALSLVDVNVEARLMPTTMDRDRISQRNTLSTDTTDHQIESNAMNMFTGI